MNENKTKRKEAIKTAAIVFLTIMLILTFFSSTIQNYSLPEVATKYVENGTITTKIRGTGTVQSGDPYVVEIGSNYIGRKVTGISCKVGDTVEKGDVLFYMNEGDGEELSTAKQELEEAKNALKAAQDEYDQFVLNNAVSESGVNVSSPTAEAEAFKKQIFAMQASLKEARDKIPAFEQEVASINQAITDIDTQIGFELQQDELIREKVNTAEVVLNQAKEKLDAATKEMSAAEEALEAAKAEKEELERKIEAGEIPEDEIETKRAEAQKKIEDSGEALKEKKAEVGNCEKNVSNSQTSYDELLKKKNEREANSAINNLKRMKAENEVKLYDVQKKLNTANSEANAIQEEMNGLLSKINGLKEVSDILERISDAREKVNEKQKEVDSLQDENGGSAIYADISGTILSIEVTSGKQIQTQDVITIQPEGQGYYMSFSVTNDQAKLLSPGDKANLINSWYYGEMDIVLRSIKPDKQNPGKMKVLNFSVEGDVTEGQMLNVSVGQRSQSYDLIVPNSAIREDNNGKFILIVESKSSPLGNRYIATRVDVVTLASDDTQTAISAPLNGWEYVITTSSKPINPGSQVRMSEN